MDKMIYCQKDIPKDELRYSLRSSAVTGCGWIATYNALHIMGYNPDKNTLINYYKKQIPLLNGNIGTFVLSPAIFFKEFGFPVRITLKNSEFDRIAEHSDVCILYFWWKNKFKIGAHFVALHKTDKGFIGYNTYNNSKGPDMYGQSIEEFIKRKKYFGTMLIGIKDRRK